jgi:hypothetical protein
MGRINLYHNILSHHNLFDVMYELENRFVPVIEKITQREFIKEVVDVKNKNSILAFLNYKTQTELIHQLNYKTDIAGMLQTIEIREPMLDYRLFELQQRFSENIFYDKSKSVRNKYLYRRILSSYNKDLAQLKKRGFKVDLDRVFKKNSIEIDEIINTHQSAYVNLEYIKGIWTKYKEGRVDFEFMNRILSFLLWEKNLKNRI